MSEAYRVRLRTVGDGPTALGEAGPFTLVTDRPTAAGGGGLGFNGGQLLYLSIAACWSNDLYREAATMGIELDGVEITVDGDFPARGSGSTPISVEVVVRSSAPEARVRALIAEVERVAEIPRAIRDATAIRVNASVERPG
ncbi:MAG TPA: OsmC family protein [Patescibacteria group bacterium]|jgi:organic hydroperoxide reductase OsmC/OhrA|nr:OsmC family protein [Patescibacteria group bacterium]